MPKTPGDNRGRAAYTEGMDDLTWMIFRETGEPMGYLLYRANRPRRAAAPRRRDRNTQRKKGGGLLPPAL